MRNIKRSKGRLLAALVSAVLGSALVATPAHAATPAGAYSDWFVDGGGAVTDDWGDHYSELGHSLCYGCADSWNTDLVILWQTVLYADGYLGASGIDGEFGPNTRDATKNWQSYFGLTADGWVGNATWSTADNRLTSYNNGYYVYYNGRYGKIAFSRGVAGDGQGAYRFDYAIKGSTTVWLDPSPCDSCRIQFFRETYTVRVS